MKSKIEQTSHNAAKRRILVVTDEPGLSQILSHVFKHGGFEVCIAATGTDCLRLVEEQNYDLILSDIDLPDLSGFEICRRVKQNPQLRSVLIILMSGWLAEGNKERALRLGAVDYLNKPFRVETILKKVSAHIRGTKSAS
jgi:DNA-binding response OmpR family regulator